MRIQHPPEQEKTMQEFREWCKKCGNYPAVETLDRYLKYLAGEEE